jgi:ribonuclease P protein component
MLTSANRFHGGRDIQHAYKQAKMYRSRYFGVRVLEKNNDTFRAVVVVSKKISKSAVTRNRIRRRLYELLRTHRDATRKSHVIVNVYDASLAIMPTEAVQAEFLRILSKAGLLAQATDIRGIVEGKED